MVVLLTLRTDCLRLALKPASSSPHLPEIQEDVGSDKLKQWVGGEKKLQAFMEWANDDFISGKDARHSTAFARKWIERFKRERGLLTRYRRETFPGTPCPIDLQDIIQQWIAAK